MKTSVTNQLVDDPHHEDKDYKIEFQNLKKSLVILFIVAAFLVSATLVLLNFQFSKLIDGEDNISYIINISGRQRMLSQNITKTSLLLLQGETSRLKQLDSIRVLFTNSHQELVSINSSLKSSKLDSQFSLISESFLGLSTTSGKILAGERGLALKKKLLSYEERFLPQMDAIVKEYEIIGTKAFTKANQNVNLLFCLIAVFVILSGVIVYLVAMRIIKKYSHELSQKTSELDQAKLEIEKVRLKEQFAFVASHDLQEPIRTILSLTELMGDKQSDQLDDDGKQILNFIKESSERMSEQIKGLLDYSRLGRGSILESVNLNHIFTEIEQDLRLQIEESSAVITKNELPEVAGYKLELRSVFQNLISNAIKFRKQSAIPKVEVSCSQTDHEWIFSIKDNGIGMNPQYSEKIFKIFQRLNNRDKYTGVGVGLALCKHIVEMHHGSIWVETVAGKGSTFSFTISKRLGVN